MGSFFTNVHVSISPADRRAGLQRLRESIISALKEEGFDVAGDGHSVERTILIAETSNPEWVVVYDEQSDHMDEKALERLAKAASTDRFAVSALVADSDEFALTLFARGKRTDKLHFTPGADRPTPEPNAWKALLGDRADELLDAFNRKRVFAEEPLDALVKLMEWDGDRACLGYRNRDELPAGPLESLHFAQRPERRFYSFSEGPPEMQPELDRAHTSLVLGLQIADFVCGATFINTGRLSRGLTVLIEYTPEVEEFLDIRFIRIGVGDPPQRVEVNVERIGSEGGTLLSAHFPEIELLPKPIWGPLREEWQAVKLSEMGIQRRLWITAGGTAKKAGKFSMRLWALPDENDAEEAFPCDVDVTVHAEKWWR